MDYNCLYKGAKEWQRQQTIATASWSVAYRPWDCSPLSSWRTGL